MWINFLLFSSTHRNNNSNTLQWENIEVFYTSTELIPKRKLRLVHGKFEPNTEYRVKFNLNLHHTDWNPWTKVYVVRLEPEGKITWG